MGIGSRGRVDGDAAVIGVVVVEVDVEVVVEVDVVAGASVRCGRPTTAADAVALGAAASGDVEQLMSALIAAVNATTDAAFRPTHRVWQQRTPCGSSPGAGAPDRVAAVHTRGDDGEGDSGDPGRRPRRFTRRGDGAPGMEWRLARTRLVEAQPRRVGSGAVQVLERWPAGVQPQPSAPTSRGVIAFEVDAPRSKANSSVGERARDPGPRSRSHPSGGRATVQRSKRQPLG